MEGFSFAISVVCDVGLGLHKQRKECTRHIPTTKCRNTIIIPGTCPDIISCFLWYFSHPISRLGHIFHPRLHRCPSDTHPESLTLPGHGTYFDRKSVPEAVTFACTCSVVARVFGRASRRERIAPCPAGRQSIHSVFPNSVRRNGLFILGRPPVSSHISIKRRPPPGRFIILRSGADVPEYRNHGSRRP